MSRDTSTGKVFEQSVLPALEHARYKYRKQVNIGKKPNQRKQIVDLVVYDENRKIWLSGIDYAALVGKCQQMRHRSRKRSKFLKP